MEANHTESVVFPAFQSNKGQECLRVEEVVSSTTPPVIYRICKTVRLAGCLV